MEDKNIEKIFDVVKTKDFAQKALVVFRNEQKIRTTGVFTGCYCNGCIECMEETIKFIVEQLKQQIMQKFKQERAERELSEFELIMKTEQITKESERQKTIGMIKETINTFDGIEFGSGCHPEAVKKIMIQKLQDLKRKVEKI